MNVDPERFFEGMFKRFEDADSKKEIRELFEIYVRYRVGQEFNFEEFMEQFDKFSQAYYNRFKDPEV